jgi:hypothetical protein
VYFPDPTFPPVTPEDCDDHPVFRHHWHPFQFQDNYGSGMPAQNLTSDSGAQCVLLFLDAYSEY